MPDLFSFIKEHPDCPVDPVFVNMDVSPLAVEGHVGEFHANLFK